MKPRGTGGLSLVLTLAVLLGLAAPHYAPLYALDPGRMAKGETVTVATDDTEFYEEQEIAARLEKGTPIKVVELYEGWVGCTVTIDGKDRSGWVHSRGVVKPDDPAAVAAVKQFKIRVENNFLGNVLRIDANDADIPGSTLARLQGLYSLEGLELSGTKITNDDLRHLRGLTNLRWLYLDNTAISDDGLRHLSTLARLDVLALNKSQVRGPGLSHLKPLKALRVLNLSECKLDDASLEHIQGMGRIQTLALQETPINGSGLKFLKDMPRLNVLNLNDCKLRDGTLLHLRGAQELRILHLDGAQADQASKDALEDAIDGLAIFD